MRLLINRDLIRLALFAGVVTMHAGTSWGQEVIKIDVEQADITGTLVRAGPLAATVSTPRGACEVDLVNQEFRDLNPARIEVKGERSPAILRPGMTIRFAAEIKNKRTIRDPLPYVTLIDPTSVDIMSGDGDEAGLEPETVKELIVGRIRTIRRGVLSLEVLGQRKTRIVQATLADDAVVRISANNLAAALPGDKIQVRGWQRVGSDLKHIWAEEVRVTALKQPADARAAAPTPERARRAFGDAAPEEKPSSKEDVKYKGVILEIN